MGIKLRLQPHSEPADAAPAQLIGLRTEEAGRPRAEKYGSGGTAQPTAATALESRRAAAKSSGKTSLRDNLGIEFTAW
ncbi:MAG: hypothetical protein AB2L09_07420 [Coriobacteriia bacterium]